MGHIHTFDLSTGDLVGTTLAAPDTISSVSIHSTLPLIATTSGHRRFGDDEDEESDHSIPQTGCNSLRMWHLQPSQNEFRSTVSETSVGKEPVLETCIKE